MNTGGLVVTVIGVGTVFTALVSLTGLVTLLGRQGGSSVEDAPQPAAELAARGQAPSAAASESSPTAAAADAPEPGVELERVALAAFALHRQHRIDRGSSRDATGWVHSGRIRATATFHR